MDDTHNLKLPYILAAQAQKHVTHNEALRALDAIVQLAVLDRDLTTPPASPTDGDRYIVAPSATGDWAGNDGKIAAWQDGAWAFYDPQQGWLAWIGDENALVAWDGTAWTTAGGGGGGSFNPVTGNLVGVNATADTTNRLSLNSPASLFNHEGNGHQQKINKAAVGDTASQLYQTNFSGRAEVGLTGDDDFHFKVSPDGSTFHEAIVIDKDDGSVQFPSGARTKRRVDLGSRFYCQTDNRWVGFSTSYGIATENQNSSYGTGAEPTTYWTSLGVFLRAGEKVQDYRTLIRASSLEVTGFDVRLHFSYGTPGGASFNNNAEATVDVVHSDNNPISMPSTGWYLYDPTIVEYTAPTDGVLILILRPIGTLSALRYFYLNGSLDLLVD